MQAVYNEAPRVRDAPLANTLEAYFVAPVASAWRDPTSTLLELERTTLSRQRKEPSLPMSLVSSLANVFDKPVEDDGPGLRRILLPTPPPKGVAAHRGPLHRRRQRRAAIEASAAEAASHTLQRRQEQLDQLLQHSLLSFSSARGRAFFGLSLEAWQPPYLKTNDSAVEEKAITRKVTTVRSPCATTSHLEPSRPPSAATEHKGGATALSWRLRRRRGDAATPALSPAANPSPIASLLDRKKNPLDGLRYLGAATFNDAPLHTFLSSLDLRMQCSRSSTGNILSATETGARDAGVAAEQSRWHTFRDHDRRRRRSSRQRNDAVEVHLGDAEAHTFRVVVVAGETSPLQSVVDACDGCVWDGSEFFLLPLEDRPLLSFDALPANRLRDPKTLLPDEDSTAASGAQTASLSFAQESQTGLELPGTPMNFLRAAKTFETNSTGVDEGCPPNAPTPPLPTPPTGFVIDGPVFGRALEGGHGGEGEVVKSVVPCWKRFCTTTALYLILGDAGCCDTAHFPYPAVQLCTWGDLVAQQQTRIEMMASCSPAALHILHAARGEKKSEPVPVALLFPTSRKGVMRRPLSITTQPFTDAEVFQLFYLQLVFRAYFDVRFPTLAFRLPRQTVWHLRSDLIAVRSSGTHPVAFEHPLNRDAWLRFPTHTRLLTLLNLDEAIVPLYATPAELQETAVLPLFGSGDSLPCLGAAGHAVAQWAATVEVSSPAAAMSALAELFDKMDAPHRTTRAELWRSSVGRRSHGEKSQAPLLFRCGASSVGMALDRHVGTLARFFVLPEKRGVPVTQTETLSTNHDDHASAECSAMLSNTTRHTMLPCIPHTSSAVNTAVSSPAGTPHQPALNHMVLRLDAFAAGDGCSGTREPCMSTVGASPIMSQSRTNAFASTFDVVHLSALQLTDDAEAATASSREARKASMTQAPAASPDTEGDAAIDADVNSNSDAATVAGMQSCTSLIGDVPSSTKKSRATADSVAKPLLPLTVAVDRRDDIPSTLCDTRSDMGDSGAATQVQNLSVVGAASPFTKQESLVTRWRYYMQSGNCSIFDGATAGIQLFEFLGRGGSGLVYRGTYGSRRLPVAVKVLIIPDGMSHDHYVRESLTDVAFYVLANQLNDYSISYNGRAHDFIVSSEVPAGLPAADAAEARRGRDPASTKLCYFITDLMDGTIGRFLDSNDDDFDPMYDQLLNSPLRESELFQFLFNQLAFKTLFDWRVLDLMLNNQLRGDNVGYRYVSLPPERAVHLREHPEEAASLALARQYYAGLLYAFQFSPDDSVKYLRFPAEDVSGMGDRGEGGSVVRSKNAETPLRLICMIDVGQGIQPNIAELVRNEYIGETVVASCVEDDGFGRYWPLNELYCRNVNVKGEFSDEVVAWGSKVRVETQQDAFHALQELFLRYHATYGVDAPTEEELRTYLCLAWTPQNVTELKEAYVYRAE